MRHNRFATFALFMISLFLLAGCKAFYGMFYADPAHPNASKQIKTYDAIIVPGCPNDSHSLRLLLDRVYWAEFLYKKGIAKHIIFSGSAVYTPYYEAKVMRLYALALGIPSDVIYLETKAEHTTENVYYSYKISDSLGFKNLAFATQAIQASSMKQFVKKLKLKIDMLPIITDSIRNYNLPKDSIQLSSAYCNNWVSIVERESLFKRLRGTMGHKVKKEIRKNKKLKKQSR